jgi:transposase InsO family protein
MDILLAGFVGLNALVYIDDIIIFSETVEQHFKDVADVLDRIADAKMVIKISKSKFFRTETPYLGYIVGREGLKVDPEKTKVLKEMPPPRNIGEIRRFTGLASYYRRFIKNFADMAEPLSRLTKKDEEWRWGEEQQRAYEGIIRSLTEPPVLTFPDFKKQFVLETDASQRAISAILGQQDEKGGTRVISYASRILTAEERNYTPAERECLAVVFGTKLYRVYLHGAKFKLITDSTGVKLLNSHRDSHGRMMRWALHMQDFDFEIEHRPGRLHVAADCLTRPPAMGMSEDEVDKEGGSGKYANPKPQVNNPKPEVTNPKPHVPEVAATNVQDEWREKEIKGDGNCLFRALAQHIHGTEEEHEKVRQEVVDHMEKNWTDYAPFAIKEKEKKGAYLKKMRGSGCWGGQVEISAAASRYGLSIVVHQKDNSSPPQSHGAQQTEAKRICHLQYVTSSTNKNYKHYNLLVKKAPTKERTRAETLQREDQYTEQLIKYLEEGKKTPAPADVEAFEMHEGLLYRKETFNGRTLKCLVVPAKMKEEILHQHHGSLAGGHYGRTRTLERMKLQYWWRGMKKDVEAWTRSCDECAKAKKRGGAKHQGLLQPFPATRLWERIAVDLIIGLPRSKKGNTIVATFSEAFSKFKWAYALPNKEAATVAKIYIERILWPYGAPEKLLSDRGTEFLAEIMKEVNKCFDVKKINTTSYHPQTDGEVEKFNGTLKEQLRAASEHDHTSWDQYLPAIVSAYNATPHPSTGEIPFYIVSGGRQYTLPQDHEKKAMDAPSSPAAQQQLLRQVKVNNKVISNNLQAAARKAKDWYDSHSTKDIDVKVGELYWMVSHKKPEDKQGVALMPKWEGPYRVMQKKGPVTVRIRHEHNSKKEQIVHVNSLKPYFGRQDLQSNPEGEGEVEGIVAWKKKGGENYYRIRWSGYTAKYDTWEKEEDVHAPDLLRTFKNNHKLPSGPKTTNDKPTEEEEDDDEDDDEEVEKEEPEEPEVVDQNNEDAEDADETIDYGNAPPSPRLEAARAAATPSPPRPQAQRSQRQTRGQVDSFTRQHYEVG